MRFVTCDSFFLFSVGGEIESAALSRPDPSEERQGSKARDDGKRYSFGKQKNISVLNDTFLMPEVENMLWKMRETGDSVITRGGFFKKMTTDAAFVVFFV